MSDHQIQSTESLPSNGTSNVASLGQKHLEKLAKNNTNYGRPAEGTKTLQRGLKAHAHVAREVKDLCDIIAENGIPCEDGTYAITFEKLFKIYVTISNKVVGILLRARKRGFVHFEGEMLYQGRDDNVIIRLIQMPPKDFVFTF